MNTIVSTIFKKEAELVEKGKCPFCEKTVNVTEFRDTRSRREFKINGTCQSCQDDIFGEHRCEPCGKKISPKDVCFIPSVSEQTNRMMKVCPTCHDSYVCQE